MSKPKEKLSAKEEQDLIAAYRNGDDNAIGQLIWSHAGIIKRAINETNCPDWIDKEDVFSDMMVEVVKATRRYDPNRCRYSSYIYGVAKRIAPRFVSESMALRSETIEDCDVFPDSRVNETPVDVIDRIRAIFDATPDSQIGEEGRRLVDRILRGTPISEIAQQMGWGRPYTTTAVAEMRDEIAWRLLKSGSSAEPWISDCELAKMAARHSARISEWIWDS